jgi:hypothetical protein
MRSRWYTGLTWLPRNSSASFRASIRSLSLPSFNRAFLRGSQTTTWLTWGFRRSRNRAAHVPSSKVTARVPRGPCRNSRIVASELGLGGVATAGESQAEVGSEAKSSGFCMS